MPNKKEITQTVQELIFGMLNIPVSNIMRTVDNSNNPFNIEMYQNEILRNKCELLIDAVLTEIDIEYLQKLYDDYDIENCNSDISDMKL